MREIKFRGICKNENKFVYGNYIEKHNPQKKEPTFWCCFIQDKAITMTGVSRESVGQYTGLKDKNGIEIYEGDILSSKWFVQVYKDKKTGAYMVKFKTNPKVNKPLPLYEYLQNRSRAQTDDRDNIVISNIHQNPELLKCV